MMLGSGYLSRVWLVCYVVWSTASIHADLEGHAVVVEAGELASSLVVVNIAGGGAGELATTSRADGARVELALLLAVSSVVTQAGEGASVAAVFPASDVARVGSL